MKTGGETATALAKAVLEGLAMLLLGAAAVAAWTGGWRAEVFGVTLSARSAGRLLAFALALLAVRAALSRDHLAPARELLAVAARVIAGAVLVAGLIAWATHVSPFVGGADSYGYVSAAERMRQGELIQREPLAALLPYPNAIDAATPLGYIPTARAADSSVPVYPLGLPALMAVASIVAGPRAPLFVAPFAGFALVVVCGWVVYRWTHDMTLALAAGAAVTWHPLVFTYAIQPMSDVPAAAFYVLAGALLFRGYDGDGAAKAAPLLAGFAASAAFLIRPALLPGAAALAIIPFMRGDRRRLCITLFACLIALGVGLQALSQWHLYGHPLANGYGPASELFSLAHLPANTRSYGYWMVAMHGLIWIAGLLVALGRVGALTTRVAIALPLVAATAPYAVYRTYDHWETLRFLLPLLVVATVAAVAGLFATCRGLLPRVGTWVALALTMVMIGTWVRWLDRERVFERSIAEERFARAGDLVSRVTPSDAVVLASLHSGSVRHYARRQTLDWAKIPSAQFDAVVAALERDGRAVFVMLDGEEEQMQFAENTATCSTRSAGCRAARCATCGCTSRRRLARAQ
jgi:hypothetical protein